MESAIADALRAALDYLMRVAPPVELWRITLITCATFAAVQAFKYVSRLNPEADGYGPAVLRGLGVILGPAFAWVFWPVKEAAPIVAIGLIGWVGAHLLATFGMRWLSSNFPAVYQTIERRDP